MKNFELKLMLLLVVLLLLNNPIHAKIVSFDKNTDGITFNLDKGLMKVKICMDNMVEVKYTELPVFMDKPSLVVTNEWKIIPSLDILIEREEELAREDLADLSAASSNNGVSLVSDNIASSVGSTVSR